MERRSEPEDDAVMAAPPALDDTASTGIDDAAESAFLAETRARGEVVNPPGAAELVEETERTPLPKLDELVERIPANVRDALEDLFRARFVSVKRIPKKALKS